MDQTATCVSMLSDGIEKLMNMRSRDARRSCAYRSVLTLILEIALDSFIRIHILVTKPAPRCKTMPC